MNLRRKKLDSCSFRGYHRDPFIHSLLQVVQASGWDSPMLGSPSTTALRLNAQGVSVIAETMVLHLILKQLCSDLVVSVLASLTFPHSQRFGSTHI